MTRRAFPNRLVAQFALGCAVLALAACGSSIDKPKKSNPNNANNTENNVTPNNTTANNPPNNTTANNPPNNTTVNNPPNNGVPCVGLAPASLNFGDVAIGAQAEATVSLENCSSTESLTLTEVALADGFDILPPGGEALPPQQTMMITVVFSPDVAGGHVGQLVFVTSAGQASLNVQGNGIDVIEECPTPVARGRAGADQTWSDSVFATPLQTVELTAMESIAPGDIDRYEWSIVRRPSGSTARLNPSATVQSPELFLDLAGIYEIELRVYTANSPDDCPATRIVIDANAGDPDAIHVQLVWDTPGDADLTDQLGADLDLHYLHPNGTWNMAPYDCYFANKDADWGADGMASVDIDDLNGAGPENINHQNAGPLTYAVGVHYYSSNSFGPSTATVRLFRGGVQVVELSEALPNDDDFWYVGDYDAAADSFMSNGTVTSGFPP